MKSRFRQIGQGLETLERRNLLSAVPFGASSQDTGEFLLGDVSINVVFLESNGAIDEETEDWNAELATGVKARIEEGAQWWVDTLAKYSNLHKLDFHFDYTYADNPAEISYEPISRRSQDFQLWIEEFFREANVPTSAGFSQEIRDFNHQKRIEHGTNWSFTIFVVNAEADGDDRFAAGSDFNRAFAYTGGRFMVMPHSRPAATVAHELAHIFWAHDEYSSGDPYTAHRGYYGTQNTNGGNGNPSRDQESSILVTTTISSSGPYANHRVSQSGRETLGWRDSDGDGIFDVLDVNHSISGSITFDPASRTARFVGNSSVQTLDNLNTSGTGRNMTINRITDLQFRLDGGEWQDLAEFDDYQVTMDVTTPAIPVGITSVEFRTIDDRINVASAAVARTIDSGAPLFQNPLNQFDVSGDTHVSPVDVLQVIRAINDGMTQLTVGGPPYLDVSGDGELSPRDALLVIEHINKQNQTAKSNTEVQAAALAASPSTSPAAAASSTDAVLALFSGRRTRAGDDEFWHQDDILI